MTVQRFPVEAGHVLTFARSLGDTAEMYSDSSFATTGFSGVVAPPTFVQASAQFDPEYPLRPRAGEPWFGSPPPRTDASSASSESPVSSAPAPESQVLHAEQAFEFVRPVRVGDVLSSQTRTGNTWEKDGRKGGRLVFTELLTEFRDQSGALVVTATAVTVRTERVPGDGDR